VQRNAEVDHAKVVELLKKSFWAAFAPMKQWVKGYPRKSGLLTPTIKFLTSLSAAGASHKMTPTYKALLEAVKEFDEKADSLQALLQDIEEKKFRAVMDEIGVPPRMF